MTTATDKMWNLTGDEWSAVLQTKDDLADVAARLNSIDIRKRVSIVVPNAWAIGYRLGMWCMERKGTWEWGGGVRVANLMTRALRLTRHHRPSKVKPGYLLVTAGEKPSV